MKAAWATTADYYSAYDMSFNMGDAVLYAIEQAMATLTFAFIAFISGWIISEVRRQNPDNFRTVEEVEAEKAAKKAAKEAKVAAKKTNSKAD